MKYFIVDVALKILLLVMVGYLIFLIRAGGSGTPRYQFSPHLPSVILDSKTGETYRIPPPSETTMINN